MKELVKILVYLAATVVLAALIAPWLFHAGEFVTDRGILPALADTPFQRYFNRAVLIAAVILLWPLVKWLGIQSWGEFGLRRDPRRWSHLLFGIIAAVLVMACLGTLLVQLDLYKIRKEIEWSSIGKILLSATGASIAEEFLFRGAILGLLMRSLPRAAALFLTSALFSIVHFLKPPENLIAPESVTFLSGLMLVPHAFWQFTEPMLVLAGFTTLFMMGWVLGYSALKTRALWLPIGLHAGLIIGKFGFGKIAKRREEALPWFGSEIQIGIGPLVALLILGLMVWAWLRYADRAKTSSPA